MLTNETMRKLNELKLFGMAQGFDNQLSSASAAHLAGRTENFRVVNFHAPAEHIGRFVDVTITEAMSHTLRGRLAANC